MTNMLPPGTVIGSLSSHIDLHLRIAVAVLPAGRTSTTPDEVIVFSVRPGNDAPTLYDVDNTTTLVPPYLLVETMFAAPYLGAAEQHGPAAARRANKRTKNSNNSPPPPLLPLVQFSSGAAASLAAPTVEEVLFCGAGIAAAVHQGGGGIHGHQHGRSPTTDHVDPGFAFAHDVHAAGFFYPLEADMIDPVLSTLGGGLAVPDAATYESPVLEHKVRGGWVLLKFVECGVVLLGGGGWWLMGGDNIYLGLWGDVRGEE